jgi:hypothetical protein
MTISEEEIESFRKRFVREDPSISEIDHSSNVSAIDSFIAGQDQELREMEIRSRTPACPEFEESLEPCHHHKLAQVKKWLSEVQTEIYDFQLSRLRDQLTVAVELSRYVSKTPHTVFDFEKLASAGRTAITKNEGYQKLRATRRRFIVYVQQLLSFRVDLDYVAWLQSEIKAAAELFDAELNHSPPSSFDTALEEYIRRTPELSVLVVPAASVIAEGTPLALMATVSEFNIQLMRFLNITAGIPRCVLYASLVRFLFDVGYTMSPASLMGSKEENQKFLESCHAFSTQTVHELGLPPDLTQKVTVGLPLSSLFKLKHVEMLKDMELMTNPIDLMHHVHTTLGGLAKLFANKEQFLSFDDTLTLLLAVMSLSPPVNALAISRFVVKWEQVQLSSVVQLAKNYFVAAVEQIQLFAAEASK